MDFFRTKSKMHLSTWDEKQLIMLELTPALDGAAKGQPQAGEIRYDKDKKVNISFHTIDAFRFAYALGKLADGEDITFSKMADTSKIAGNANKEVKNLSAIKSNKGGAMVTLKSNENSITIILSPDEAYAVKKYFEIKAGGYI